MRSPRLCASAASDRGDRVGVRVRFRHTRSVRRRSWGSSSSGAAYVPVDVDDPDARARTVFAEADVAAVIGNGLMITSRRAGERVTAVDEDAAATPIRRMGHLHLWVNGHPQRRRGLAPFAPPRSSMPRPALFLQRPIRWARATG